MSIFFKRKKHKALILMYHRINTAVSDTWQLSVSPDHFQEQLSCLKDYTIIALQQLIAAIKENNIPENAIALTFDDGYLDNYLTAVPLLEQYQFPASFFITNSIDSNKEFWWDALEYILLENDHLPETVSLSINHTSHTWHLNQPWQEIVSEDKIKEFASWLPWKIPPSAKHALFLHLSILMKSVSVMERENILLQLFRLSEKKAGIRTGYKLMGQEHLVAISKNHLFEIGCHSANHIALANFDSAVQEKEIIDNKIFLETLLYREVNGYGFAHGSYDEHSIRLLKEKGFRYACTTEEKSISVKTDPFILPRMQVKNWNKIQFQRQLKNRFNS